MKSLNLWRIEGVLTARTPLHIGSGEILNPPPPGLEGVEVDAVAAGYDQKPCIPGTTLKCKLRSWLEEEIDSRNVDLIFGSSDASDDAIAGNVSFGFARAFTMAERAKSPPYWEEKRWTGVSVSVAIDRRTRTAAEARLFHRQFVPPGISFKVELDARNLEEAQIEDLLFGLEAFNLPEDPLSLGSQIADDWGQLDWKPERLCRMGNTEIGAWLESTNPLIRAEALSNHPIPEDQQKQLFDSARSRRSEVAARPRLRLDLRLEFDGPFLVNDPRDTKDKKQSESDDPNRPADHSPLVDEHGRLVLPAASFRGALRSQAERILRTIAGPAAACLPTSANAKERCREVQQLKDLNQCCPACRMLGTPGWRSPLAVSSFVSESPLESPLPRQEFLAIDRFTGGGAAHLKFNADYAYKPVLCGHINLDLEKARQAGFRFRLVADESFVEALDRGSVPNELATAAGFSAEACRVFPISEGSSWLIRNGSSALEIILDAGQISAFEFGTEIQTTGLLALALRDIAEGDVPFGFGAAKGYGSCRLCVEKVRISGYHRNPALTQLLLQTHSNRKEDLVDPLEVKGSAPPPLLAAVEKAVDQLRQNLRNVTSKSSEVKP